MYRKTEDEKLKRYWYSLLGKEFYSYKKKEDKQHKDMHSLIGVFIKAEKEEQLDQKTVIYPMKLYFPMNKVRVYYTRTKDERNKWVNAIKQAIGYAQVEDYYEIQGIIGKGKFG